MWTLTTCRPRFCFRARLLSQTVQSKSFEPTSFIRDSPHGPFISKLSLKLWRFRAVHFLWSFFLNLLNRPVWDLTVHFHSLGLISLQTNSLDAWISFRIFIMPGDLFFNLLKRHFYFIWRVDGWLWIFALCKQFSIALLLLMKKLL